MNITLTAINRAEAQLDRGEGIDFDQFAAEMRRKIAFCSEKSNPSPLSCGACM